MKTFKYLSPDSRVWIYQSSRAFTNDEHTLLNDSLINFCRQWTAHNNQLVADFEVVYDRFVVLVVDESGNSASGCSIDKSVHFLKEIGQEFNIDFFDKLQMAYLQYGELLTAPYARLKQMYQQDEIDSETLFFDTNVSNLNAYTTSFVRPLSKHWLMTKIV